MKIEKINDTKIRCTLTGDDLDAMNIKLTDLILKKDKSRALFDDILEAAFIEYNFKPGDSPMMIEALPGDDNSVVLTFTIVDSTLNQNNPLANLLGNDSSNSNDLGGLIGSEKRITSEVKKTKSHTTTITDARVDGGSNIYSFKTIDEVMDAIGVIKEDFIGKSNLHFDKSNKLYILTIFNDQLSDENYNKICNTLCEFSVLEICNPLSLAYLTEYCQLVVANNAVEIISQI